LLSAITPASTFASAVSEFAVVSAGGTMNPTSSAWPAMSAAA